MQNIFRTDKRLIINAPNEKCSYVFQKIARTSIMLPENSEDAAGQIQSGVSIYLADQS